MDSQVEEIGAKYKAGSIKFIKLINFMCHGSFELPLGPNVNFIIGPNGSGKSALLTALTVALGARATLTTRGKRASDFIKYGSKWARIIIVIHNYDKVMDKDQAFKPNDYGKTITVEKTLYRDDAASKLVLKNEHDKKVSERKTELDEMLDHFGIVVNNPICILNQEVSKTFLHSKRPEDKFDLFMKATNLEQIEEDYNSASQSYEEWDGCIKRKNAAFTQLDREKEACEEKIDFIINSTKLSDLKSALTAELMFATERDIELEGKKLEEKVKELNKVIEEAQIVVDNRKEKIKKFEEDIDSCRAKIQSIDKNIEESRSKIRDIRGKETHVKERQLDIKTKISTLNRKISRNINDQSSLEKSIENKKRELKEQNDLDNDSEQRKLEVESLEREIPVDHAREKSIRSHTNQLSESMTSVRAELHSANMRVTELKTKQSQHHAVLRRLKNGQDNSLRKYGDVVIKIREEIDKAHVAGRFKHKPVGPLGYYVKLRDPDVSGPLEIHLGKNAHAFVCDNHQDMNALLQIFKRFSSAPQFRQPLVLTRSFGMRHDVSRFRAHHPTHPTLLDCLEITDDAAYNALVDRCFLECVLYIADYHVAESIMIDQKSVPRNTRMAYTKDCSTMHPRTVNQGYRSFANKGGNRYLFSDSNTRQINELERELANLDADLRDAEELAKTIQLNLGVQRGEYEQNMNETKRLITEIRKKEEKLLNLKTTITVQPQELSALESELENLIHSIATEKLNVEKLEETLSLMQKDLDDIQIEKREANVILDKHTKDRNDELKIVDATKKSIDDAKLIIREKLMVIRNRTEDLNGEKDKLEANHERLARSKQSISEDSIRPIEIRETEVVQNELNKILKQIEVQQEEVQDPDEMMANLRARLEEIENLKVLKEYNSRNFSTATKSLDLRKQGFAALREITVAAVATTFSSVMRTMKMNGTLQIHLDDVIQDGQVLKKARTLDMRIDTNYTPSQRVGLVMGENDSNNNTSQLNRRSSRSQPAGSVNDTVAPSRPKRARVESNNGNHSTQVETEKENELKMTDCRSLSGGERSFSTVAFVLALWHHCTSPFKLMDEIDVFMDMVTRRVSYNALIRFAQVSTDPGQFIFFSPLELPKIDNSGTTVRVFEMPIIVRKRPHSQMNEGGDGSQVE